MVLLLLVWRLGLPLAISRFVSRYRILCEANLSVFVKIFSQFEIQNVINLNMCHEPRRGFTIKLKRLKSRAPDFGGSQNFESKDNFQHFCKQYIFIFGLVQPTFFIMPLIEDLYRRMSAKDWSEWRWSLKRFSTSCVMN